MHKKLKVIELKRMQDAQLDIEARIKQLTENYAELNTVVATLKKFVTPALVKISERDDVPADVKVLLLQQIILMEKI